MSAVWICVRTGTGIEVEFDHDDGIPDPTGNRAAKLLHAGAAQVCTALAAADDPTPGPAQ